MAPTLKDIAREAGVSVATVSVVLRNEPHPIISAKTRQKVREVARRLHYRHNIHARSLRLGKSNVVGLVAFDLGAKIILRKVEALDREIWARGYRTLIRNATGHAEMEPEFIKEFASGTVEGVILVEWGPLLTADVLSLLTTTQTPIVSLEHFEGLPLDCVTVDRRHGAYLATKHLLELGHRRIGLLFGTAGVPTNAQRLQGYREALEQFGLAVDESILIETPLGYRGGYLAGKRLLSQQQRPTAIFCNNDETAIGAIRAAFEAGLHVPDDLAVVGFDDTDMAAFLPVALTTVSQPVAELAREAVALLFHRIENSDTDLAPRTITLKPRLVIRESCGAAKARRAPYSPINGTEQDDRATTTLLPVSEAERGKSHEVKNCSDGAEGIHPH